MFVEKYYIYHNSIFNITMTDTSEDGKKFQSYLTIWNVIVLLSLTIFGIVTYFQQPYPMVKMLIFTACSGGIGGAIATISAITTNNPQNALDRKEWYLVYPIIAIFMGVFSFVLLAGSLMILSGQPDATKEFIITTKLFYCGLAFLSGFSTEHIIQKLLVLSEALYIKKQ